MMQVSFYPVSANQKPKIHAQRRFRLAALQNVRARGLSSPLPSLKSLLSKPILRT
jgi:hypothetical protein